MSDFLISIAVWQTLLDESMEFHGHVRDNRIECVIEAVRERGGHTVSHSDARRALDLAAHEFEEAYLAGSPIDNKERVRIVGDALSVSLSHTEMDSLAQRLGATHQAHSLVPMPGARDALRRLAANYRVVVVSDTWLSPGQTLRAALDYHRMSEFLEDMYFSDETGVSKTSGSAWKYVADRMNIGVSRIIHIGDLPAVDGYIAMKSHCATSIVVPHPSHPIVGSSSSMVGLQAASRLVDVPDLVAKFTGRRP